MSNINDGGPAYPNMGEIFIDGPQGRMPQSAWGMNGEKGMTLRQWYAGQALAGITMALVNGIRPDDVPLLAKDAFHIADAMLAQESKEREAAK